MKEEPPFNWQPDPDNISQLAFANFLQVFSNGVTEHQFTCMYSAFIAGMVMTPTMLSALSPEEFLEMVDKEGKLVMAMMQSYNARKGVKHADIISRLSGDGGKN